MSTCMYLTCLDHNPPLRSEEVEQHKNLTEIRKYIANREAMCTMVEMGIPFSSQGGLYWANNAARFLYDHQKCKIGIQSEYGDRYLTGIDSSEEPIK